MRKGYVILNLLQLFGYGDVKLIPVLSTVVTGYAHSLLSRTWGSGLCLEVSWGASPQTIPTCVDAFWLTGGLPAVAPTLWVHHLSYRGWILLKTTTKLLITSSCLMPVTSSYTTHTAQHAVRNEEFHRLMHAQAPQAHGLPRNMQKAASAGRCQGAMQGFFCPCRHRAYSGALRMDHGESKSCKFGDCRRGEDIRKPRHPSATCFFILFARIRKQELFIFPVPFASM